MSVVPLADTRLDWSRLPRFEPEPDGWPGVLARRAARVRNRRARRAGALALALLLAALLPALMRPPSSPASTVPAVATVTALPIHFELARVDRALQRAYDRGASAGEVEALWQTRQQLAVALSVTATPIDHWVAL